MKPESKAYASGFMACWNLLTILVLAYLAFSVISGKAQDGAYTAGERAGMESLVLETTDLGEAE